MSMKNERTGKVAKKSHTDKGSATRLAETTRFRDSSEYRNQPLHDPYYESFPDKTEGHAKQEAGEDGEWID